MSLNIKISSGKGKVQNLKVKNTDKISDAKNASGYTPVSSWKWKSDGLVLKDEKTFESYNIEEDDLIIATKNQIGGEKYK